MDSFKRHFTEEAFLFSTFVEFNKCWSSGKRSRLVIEWVNGHAFVNFSAFLGHPETMHFAPGEKWSPRRYSNKKPKKKSKRKTQRDNDRAARFQEKKRQEKEAAVTEASPESPPLHSVPSAVSSPRVEFTFSEPALADVSADSSFSKMNVNGNVTSVSVSNNLLTWRHWKGKCPQNKDLQRSSLPTETCMDYTKCMKLTKKISHLKWIR